MRIVTEIPEHLLRRSRERRAALGLGGDEAPAAAPTPAAEGEAPVPATPSPSTPAVPPPRAPRPAPAAPPPPKPDPPYIAAAKNRRRIPFWVMPVVGLLPLWAYMYARGLEPPEKKVTGPVASGQTIYASKCSSCHGTAGEGGVGYELNNGEVLLTFPDIKQHFAFVYTGNKPYGGLPYGSGRHIGGQRGVPGARQPVPRGRAGRSAADDEDVEGRGHPPVFASAAVGPTSILAAAKPPLSTVAKLGASDAHQSRYSWLVTSAPLSP